MVDQLRKALKDFVDNESDLLVQDSHEGAITGQLIEYLAESFDDFDYSIDTQYNKRILDNELINKEADFLISSLPIDKWPKTWNENQEYTKKEILPDIIFHDRQSSNHNFIIIEVKKSTNKSKSDREWDFIKLSEMIKGGLNYRFGVFIDFTTGEAFDKGKPFSLTIFEKGEITLKE
jgi:hypothetical protein